MTMPVIHHPPGTPFPANHPFKGSVIIIGAKKPVPPTQPAKPEQALKKRP